MASVEYLEIHELCSSEESFNKYCGSDEKTFICPIDGCNKVFSNKRGIHKHEKMHTHVHRCEYDDCGTEFASKRLLQEHLMNVHGQGHTCPECGKTFYSKKRLSTHRQNHRKPYVCDVEECFKAFSTKKDLQRHTNTHTGAKPHVCDICGTAFANDANLRTHMNTHTHEKVYRCDHEGCEKEYYASSHLQIHKQTHENPKSHSCPHDGCDKRYAQLSGLNTHIKAKHMDIWFECPRGCGKKFRRQRGMRTHVEVVHDKIRYPCRHDGCDRDFGYTSHRNIHELSHNGVKPHECASCDSNFRTAAELRAHTFIHLGYKPLSFPDEHCDFTCVWQSALKVHISRKHSEEGAQNQKRQEAKVSRHFEKLGLAHKREHRIDFTCIDSDKYWASIDFVIEMSGGIVFLEVDENQHRFGYGSVSCDLKRMAHVMEALALDGNTLPILWIRYNPNAFRIAGKLQKVLQRDREEALYEKIVNWVPSRPMELAYMYYDIGNTGELEVFGDPSYDSYFKQLCI